LTWGVTTKQVVDLLGALIRIESASPVLVPDGAGEPTIASFIADWLSDTPAEVEIIEIEPGRPNVIARLRGGGGAGGGAGRTLCLNAHMDTVGYEGWREDALIPRLRGNRIVGLGASDDKAGCVTAMLTLRLLAQSAHCLHGDLLAAFVADAEGKSIGTDWLAKQDGIDAAIVIEPQPIGDLVIEHQGFGWIDVITRGVAAHGSEPDAGVDAIVHMAEVITRLHRLDRTKFQPYPSLLNGPAVFHTAMISGGTGYANYPDYAKLSIKIGTQPGETLGDRVAEIEAIFADVAKTEPGFNGEVVVKLDREPFVAQGHEALQEIVAEAMKAVLGVSPMITGLNAWRDAALMQSAGIPTLLMGSSGGNLHAAGEWASISEIIQLCEILSRVAVKYLA
jgi:acetylornithine deacetylase/succinyl-diaminopimelate desuccinylase-like protein